VQEVELDEGRRYTMITRALKPVMFGKDVCMIY
jgi:hypothetical protein